MIGLSATKGISSQTSDTSSDSSIGIIQQCTVLRVAPMFGLLVKLEDGKKAFVHVRKIAIYSSFILQLIFRFPYVKGLVKTLTAK